MIIAFFDPQMNMTITTHGIDAIRGTLIVIALVTIIAFFHPNLQHTVAAASFCTIVPASIGIYRVSVITSLIICIVCVEVFSDNTISTSSDFAVATTGVDIHVVAIVAGFATLEVAISASRLMTARRAVVGFDIVPVVTGFHACPDDAVATASCGAAVGAGIGGNLIVVVTLLAVSSQKAVTTPSLLTGGEAVIKLVVVAIVAGLTRLDQAIATNRNPAGRRDIDKVGKRA